MVTTRAIRVDDDVYRRLQSQAQPFEDTPNSVLRRLLSLGADVAGNSDIEATPTRKKRAADRTPREAFRRPILEAVEELGGKDRVAAVLKRVEQKMKHKLTPVDYSKTKSGLPRWSVYARWMRLGLVHQGLLRGERGYWEITEKGRAYLKGQR